MQVCDRPHQPQEESPAGPRHQATAGVHSTRQGAPRPLRGSTQCFGNGRVSRRVRRWAAGHSPPGTGDEGGPVRLPPPIASSRSCFVGREFFVGISKWTNHRGAEAMADSFRDFAVSTVPVSGDWHLKDFCSMAGPDTILLGSSEVARRALKTMEQLTDHHYETLTVPDDPAANCIYARVGQKSSVLVHRSSEDYPESVQTFQKLSDYTLVPAACTEVAKLGGALSSCSLLINKKLEL